MCGAMLLHGKDRGNSVFTFSENFFMLTKMWTDFCLTDSRIGLYILAENKLKVKHLLCTQFRSMYK